MSATAADAYKFPIDAAQRDIVIFTGRFTIGGSGAVSSSDVDDSGVTLVRASQGTYTLTYPKCVACSIHVGVLSDGTVKGAYLTARAATSGTATFKTHDAATPTVADPESGAVLDVTILAESRS